MLPCTVRVVFIIVLCGLYMCIEGFWNVVFEVLSVIFCVVVCSVFSTWPEEVLVLCCVIDPKLPPVEPLLEPPPLLDFPLLEPPVFELVLLDELSSPDSCVMLGCAWNKL